MNAFRSFLRTLIYRPLCILLCAGFMTCASAQTDSRFVSDDPAKLPQSVSLQDIEKRINNDSAADGILLSIKAKQGILRLDLIAIPGSTSMTAATRVVLMTARLAKPEYTQMRFSDEGTDLFVIDGPTIQAIGRQFVWGEANKGQNPIHLMRLFVDALRYPDGSRVAPVFPGSLFGDTAIATRTITDVFNAKWVLNKNTKTL